MPETKVLQFHKAPVVSEEEIEARSEIDDFYIQMRGAAVTLHSLNNSLLNLRPDDDETGWLLGAVTDNSVEPLKMASKALDRVRGRAELDALAAIGILYCLLEVGGAGKPTEDVLHGLDEDELKTTAVSWLIGELTERFRHTPAFVAEIFQAARAAEGAGD